MKLVLIGCVKSKRAGTHRAEALYDSALFRGRLAFARANADEWFILSAFYGLLLPSQIVDTYERAMSSMSRDERREWSKKVVTELHQAMGTLQSAEVEIHAGQEYWRWGLLKGLQEKGAHVRLPLEHKGIGEQLSWYAKQRMGV